MSRFRSTAAFATRARSSAPTIERATFVLFSLRKRALALPVESVERVVRRENARDSIDAIFAGRGSGSFPAVSGAGANPTFDFEGRSLPLVESDAPDATGTRVLIVSLPSGWVAVAVDTVHEVATVDAASIAPGVPDMALLAGDASTPLPDGVRGSFVRAERTVLVLDATRAFGAARSVVG